MPNLKIPDINAAQIAGRLTRDPDTATVGDNDSTVCKLRLAYTRKLKDGGEKVVYVTVVTWHKLAHWCDENLHKGSPVYVSGSLDYSEWKDRETGQNRSKLEITARSVQVLEWGDRDGNPPGEVAPPKDKPEPIPEDDIPF